MSRGIKICIDAITPVPEQIVRIDQVQLLPRAIQFGNSKLSLDASQTISDKQVQRYLAEHDGTILPFDSSGMMSELRNILADNKKVIIILPPTALDSAYENLMVVKSLLGGKGELRIFQASSYGHGLSVLIRAVADFPRKETSLDVLWAFLRRLDSLFDTALLIKDRGQVEIKGVRESNFQKLATRVFGRTALALINKQGELERTTVEEIHDLYAHPGRKLDIEYHRGGESLVEDFFLSNPSLKHEPITNFIPPERLSGAEELVMLHFVPTQKKIQEIAEWARYWAQVAE